MQATIRTLETRNNKYYIGYGRTAKISYELQQEQREERLYMIKQKALGVSLIGVGILAGLIVKDGSLVFITSMIGLPVIATKEHVIS